MIGRLLAVCGWLAWGIGRPFRRPRLRRAATPFVVVVATLLTAAAAAPIVVPQLDPQPDTIGVGAIVDGTASAPGTWVRLRGRIVPLSEVPTTGAGPFALLVDAEEPLRSVVVRGPAARSPVEQVEVTGRLVEAAVTVEETLPIEATVAGTPPRVAADRLVELDATPKPARVLLWPLSIVPAVLAVVLLVGARVGYPVFRRTTTVDVLSAPLGPGDRLPVAYGGRVGTNVRELADPGAALLLVRRGPKGDLLTAQPLADDGGLAPAPVTVGGGWTSGRTGDVHTVSETVPALALRSELVDATFLFARSAERDRVASLVTLERGR